LKHVHHLRIHWLIVTSPADYQGWYRTVFGAVCLDCGIEGVYAGEQNTQHAEGRLLEPGA
jgi:hypothetical protein